ncbi:XRE family transcriptional regulator [Pseudomonas sp. HR96]|uniref:helix-turn-helix domain-containing protein n=1 Tax=Pseudomonas sp. HR96 TaxID=1027966 RepID=UPI002A75EFFC|nr:XRE family transcriptional regulator [Pseudomonas sp. HR96]WPP01930.1 XRE family transcriptional regulator [Pseudomonas sp. HR96]
MSSMHRPRPQVKAALEQLQSAVEQLRGEYVDGIGDAADYGRACALLDLLTDGHPLNRYEALILIELEQAILAYERAGQEFAQANREFQQSFTPLQLLKDLMHTHQLTGSDLPEIGDKTSVSRILSGRRPLSHKMAYALARRFGLSPVAFIEGSAAAQPGTGVR